MNKKLLKILCFLLICAGAVVFAAKDYSLYDKTIGTVTAVDNTFEKSKSSSDGSHEYKENYYKQKLKIKLRNGSHKGQVLYAENSFAESGVYDIQYRRGDDVFIEQLNMDSGSLTGKITGTKRDYYVVLVLALMIFLFLLSAGKDGALTLASLLINVAMFYFVLKLYLDGHNLLFMAIPMAILFAALLLFFMYGFSEKSIVAFAAILISAGITTAIAAVILHFSGELDYAFMDYLIQPYEKRDADSIFLAEILIGCLGAITDVVVTIVITVDQIMVHSPETGKKELTASCRAVGDDVIGTMLGIMFFSNVASAIPFILLSMRNGIAFLTILRYNSFFEIARFLTGSIGIVISIPVSTAIAIYYYKHRKEVNPC